MNSRKTKVVVVWIGLVLLFAVFAATGGGITKWETLAMSALAIGVLIVNRISE